jgi:hypothetical protein
VTLMTVSHALEDTLAMRPDLLSRINYVQLDISVKAVQIVQHQSLEMMPIFAQQDIIVQKVSTHQPDCNYMMNCHRKYHHRYHEILS